MAQEHGFHKLGSVFLYICVSVHFSFESVENQWGCFLNTKELLWVSRKSVGIFFLKAIELLPLGMKNVYLKAFADLKR